jgi:NAD(P) transhydrogenase subunit alpha
VHIGVLKEHIAGERRVVAVPDTVKRLLKAGHVVSVELGAGALAGFPDALYEESGAKLATRSDVMAADLVVGVRIGPDSKIASGSTIVGLLKPLEHPEFIATLAADNVTAIAFETVPRTTLAQSMDALSSQANIAGYQAVLVGATKLQRFLPMMTTAAGTVKPAKVLILGVGVAGLQAIATGRRLGAVVSAFDVRSAASEQVESLGATFVKNSLEDHTDDGGYATELGDDEQTRVIRGLAPYVADSDLVICTAQIPGREAPLLIDDESLAGMKLGAVVVDLASATGGNTSQTPKTGESVVGGVTVVAGGQLVNAVAQDASTLLGRNLVALVEHLYVDSAALDFDDEITDGAVVAAAGSVRHPRVVALLEGK